MSVTAPRNLSEVAEDIYVYAQPNGGWCLNNAGVLVGPDGVVVVDTAATQRRAERLRSAIEALHAGPVRTVVNTHHHGDHTFGNAIVGPSATYVGHELTRNEMIDTGFALTKLWPDVEWGAINVTPPTFTFSDWMTVHIGQRRAELIHVGPAHTTNDVVVWLPGDRLLFAGDVILSGCTPFNLMGSIAGALIAVHRLRELEPTIVVCGHGAVAGPEVFDLTTAYLRRIQRLATEGRAAGLTPLEIARHAGPDEFADLIDPERMVGNLHRAYLELAGGPLGRPIDVMAGFTDMVEYNDGQLPTCLA